MDGECFLGIASNTQDYWLLGDVFLRGYYSIHDNDDIYNAKIGFVPHTDSLKKNIEFVANSPEANVGDVLWELSWLFEVYNFLKIDGLPEWLEWINCYWLY